ncbi:MAG TPA: ice-binding family protein, partial [bacterium]
MKKLIGCLMVMVSLPVAFMVGCDRQIAVPLGPGGIGSPTVTPTPTVTGSPTGTATNSPTTTSTATVTNSPTITSTATPQAGQAMVNLGSAANYVVLAYSAITNNGPTTLCGSLGIFPLSSVDGGIVMTCGGVQDVDNTAANTAKLDLGTAYTDAAGRTGGALIPAGSDIGGQTFYPGLYTDGGDLSVSSNDLTLDAQGNPNSVFIFQVSGNLIATPGRQVFLIGGAKANNVFWQVTGYCSLDTTVSFAGNIMAYTSVTLNT